LAVAIVVEALFSLRGEMGESKGLLLSGKNVAVVVVAIGPIGGPAFGTNPATKGGRHHRIAKAVVVCVRVANDRLGCLFAAVRRVVVAIEKASVATTELLLLQSLWQR
jgi:hypothetical protein